MNRFLSELSFKDHKLLFLGMLLCAYFTYHLFYGPRSLPYLQTLQSQNIILDERLGQAMTQQDDLQSKVVKLRPETLDTDLLKERARTMLGYTSENEIIVIEE